MYLAITLFSDLVLEVRPNQQADPLSPVAQELLENHLLLLTRLAASQTPQLSRTGLVRAPLRATNPPPATSRMHREAPKTESPSLDQGVDPVGLDQDQRVLGPALVASNPDRRVRNLDPKVRSPGRRVRRLDRIRRNQGRRVQRHMLRVVRGLSLLVPALRAGSRGPDLEVLRQGPRVQ